MDMVRLSLVVVTTLVYNVKRFAFSVSLTLQEAVSENRNFTHAKRRTKKAVDRKTWLD